MGGDHVDGRIIYVVCRIHPAKRGLCKGAGAGGIDFFNLGQFYLFKERISKNEFIGMALISASVLGLILIL